MNTIKEKVQAEVLVIGGGQAGILAAIECADAGKKAILVTKGPFGRDGASTWLAGWGNQMALYAPDSPEIHAADTFRAGMFVNDQRLAHNLTKELPYVFENLRKWKIRYKIIKDKVVQVEFPGGETYPRILSLAREGVMGGPEYRRVLPNQVKKRPITIMSDLIVLDLIVNDGQVGGALGLNIRNGNFITIEAKATILATGGFIGLYSYTTGSPGSIGDGIAMAYQVGAKIRDMEFINFHSLIACWPSIIRGETYVISLYYSLKGQILNKMGFDFRKRHPGKGKLSSSVIIQQEIRAKRGSPHGGVYCSFRDLPANLIQDFIDATPQKHLKLILNEAGIDIKKDAIEIAPCPLASNGGCGVDENCFTNIPGLIAAGEVVGGHEGAYTMAGNTVALQFAMGSIAGKSAIKLASETANTPSAKSSAVNAIIDKTRSMIAGGTSSGPSPRELRSKIQDFMGTYLHLLDRNNENLTRGVDEILSLKKDCDCMQLTHRGEHFNVELIDGLECRKAIIVAELAARAALTRKESRGFHYREDFPDSDNANWLKTVYLQKKGEDMAVWAEDIDMPFIEPCGR